MRSDYEAQLKKNNMTTYLHSLYIDLIADNGERGYRSQGIGAYQL